MDGNRRFILYVYNNEVKYNEIFTELTNEYIIDVGNNEGSIVLKENVLHVFENVIGKKTRIEEVKENFPEYFI